MNYKKHYDLLVTRGKSKRPGYLERHHIVPKCMGGIDENSNITYLTPEEHFIAHQLLVKMYPENRKLIFGAFMMTCSPNGDGSRVSNKLFGWLRRNLQSTISQINKANASVRCKKSGLSQRGKILSDDHRHKLSQSGKGRVVSEETREKQRIAALNRTEEQRRRRYEAATAPEAIEKYRKASANKVWMTNPTTNKTSFVNKELTQDRINDGWVFGRRTK